MKKTIITSIIIGIVAFSTILLLNSISNDLKKNKLPIKHVEGKTEKPINKDSINQAININQILQKNNINKEVLDKVSQVQDYLLKEENKSIDVLNYHYSVISDLNKKSDLSKEIKLLLENTLVQINIAKNKLITRKRIPIIKQEKNDANDAKIRNRDTITNADETKKESSDTLQNKLN